jgi:outer membrane protein assembly factor BamA
LAAALTLGGCKNSKKKTEPPGPVVRKVELEGVKAFEDDELVEYINLQPTPALTLRAKKYYIPGLEDVDKRRIEEVYDAHGYFDAKVESIDVEVVNPDKPLKRQKAHVKIVVDEGAPTIVRAMSIQWDPSTPASLDRKSIEAAATIKKGGEFSIPRFEGTKDAMVLALRDHGHALAKVHHEADVDKRRKVASVSYRIVPGPRLDIGKITIKGLDHVPEYLVRREVEDFEGKQFSPKRLRQIEGAVYGMGVFATVSVRESDVEGNRIGVEVFVSESKLQRLKLGVGLGIDPIRWDQHGILKYTHESLFGHLTQLSVRAKVGYAELPALYRPDEHGPIAKLDLGLRKKGLLEKHLVWTEQPGGELGIWQGYQFYAATNRIGVSRFFTRFVELGLSYNNRFVDFFNVSPALNRNQSILGRDFRDPYLLSFFEVQGTLHFVDDILQPQNGVRFTTTYDIAYRYIGSQFDYHKVEPDLRLYWRPHDRIALAGRGRVGFIFPYGTNPGAPIDLKLYLGGANDARGWGLRRLSPRIVDCDPNGANCQQIPIGGKTMVNGNAEFRVRTYKELWVATFLDMGDVRDEVATIHPHGWMYSTGGGVRYYTPIGAFRLDVGVRLNDDPRFPEPRIWAIHFGLGEAF